MPLTMNIRFFLIRHSPHGLSGGNSRSVFSRRYEPLIYINFGLQILSERQASIHDGKGFVTDLWIEIYVKGIWRRW